MAFTDILNNSTMKKKNWIILASVLALLIIIGVVISYRKRKKAAAAGNKNTDPNEVTVTGYVPNTGLDSNNGYGKIDDAPPEPLAGAYGNPTVTVTTIATDAPATPVTPVITNDITNVAGYTNPAPIGYAEVNMAPVPQADITANSVTAIVNY